MCECHDCLGRTPLASLIATIIVCLGVGLFCGALYTALEITLKGIFEELFLFRVPWLETMQIIFIMVGVAMGLYALLLLTYGFLATGATRQRVYSGAKCIMGGRVSAGFFLVLTYILNLLWMGMTSLCAMPIIIYIMLTSICVHEYQEKELWYFQGNCLNLSRFGIYRNFTEGVDKNALCDETELSEFCQYVHDAGPRFSLAFAGSLLIVLGLVGFSLTLTANYQRIKFTKELTEYRQAAGMEMTDITMMEHPQKAF